MLANDPLGRVLYIDLTKKRWEIKDRAELFKLYLGGTGVATQLLHEECPTGADALGPENPIILAVGPLTGSFPWPARLLPCSNLRTQGIWAKVTAAAAALWRSAWLAMAQS